MARKSATRGMASMKLLPPKLAAPAAPAPAAAPLPELPEKRGEYSFPSRSRCRRCRLTNTVAYKTRGARQYRRCRNPVCHHRYIEEGVEI